MSYRAKHSALTQEWREEHCKSGDYALGMAESFARGDASRSMRDTFDERTAAIVAGYAAIAQAHYAAANVRAKPAPQSVADAPYPTAVELLGRSMRAPTAHGWTPHGHACCIAGESSPHRPLDVARCGGPAICPKCATAAGQIHAQPQ